MNPYIQLIRPGVCGLPVLGLIIGSIVAGTASISLIFAIALISDFLLCASGNIINDFFDVEADKINAPKRPIPSGKISKKSALTFYAILGMASLILAFVVSLPFLGIVALTFIFGSIYPWKLKPIPFVKNVVVSLTAAFAFLAGGFITASIDISLGLWLLFLISFLATLAREIVKDIEDVEGDEASGLKTLPIIFGKRKSKIFAYVFLFAACALLLVPAFMDVFSRAYFAGAVPAIVLCIVSAKFSAHKARVAIKAAMYLVFLGFLLGSIILV